ncbi:MAG: hypothetical protein ACXIU8_06490 [Alkalilacustris sp.]
MPMTHHHLLAPLGQMCRTVSATLIAGVWRSRSIDQVEARIKRLGLRDQVGVVGGVLGGMVLLSLFSAQFGLVGMLAFFLAVVVLIN